MKKILLYSLLFFLSHLGYGQVTVVIELTADGKPIATDEDAFVNEDLEWTVTDVNTGCVVDHVEAYRKYTIVMGGVDAGGLSFIMIDMNVFDDCRPALEGHELIFDMKVVDKNSKFYGYTAKKSFIVPPGSVDETYRGEDAINFTGAPAVTISVSPKDLTFCEGEASGTKTKAKATVSDGNTNITWESKDGSAVAGLPINGAEADFSGLAAGTYTVVAKCGDLTSEDVTITVNEKPTVTLADVAEGCYGTDKFTLTATPGSGAASDYDYSWRGVDGSVSGPVVADQAYPKGSKSYKVQITHKTTGCISDEVSKEVIGHYAEVSISGPANVIHSATADLVATVTAKYPPSDEITNYSWTGGELAGGVTSGPGLSNVTTAAIKSPTTYVVEVTIGTLGCKTSSSGHVVEPGNRLWLEANGNTGCEGSEIVLSAQGKDGSGDYTYTWEPGPGLTLDDNGAQYPKVAAGVTAGNYTVQVTVNDGYNEVSSGVLNVTVKKKPVLSNIKADPDSGVKGMTSTLTVDVEPTEASLQWSSPDNMIASGESTGIAMTKPLNADQRFEVSARLSGCEAKDQVTVHILGDALTADATGAEGCEGETLKLNVTPHGGVSTDYSYTWSPSAGLILDNVNIKQPTVDATVAPGTYTATCEVSDGTYTFTTDPVQVVVKTMPVLSNIVANPASGFKGLVSALSVEVVPPEAELSWSPASMIASGEKTVSATTTALQKTQKYTVTASLNKCEASDEVTVTILGDALAITEVKGATGCEGATGLALNVEAAGGTGNYTYEWQPGAGLELDDINAKSPKVKTSVPAGTYTAKVVVSDGETDLPSDEVQVVVETMPKLADLTANPASGGKGLEAQLSVKVEPVTAELKWTPANMIVSGATATYAKTVPLNETQEFIVTATLGNCVATDQVRVEINGGELKAVASGANGCFGSADLVLNVDASGDVGSGYTYTWKPSEGLELDDIHARNPKVKGNVQPKTYTATCEVGNGLDTVISNEVVVVVKPVPVLSGLKATPASGLNAVTPNLEVTVNPGTTPLTWGPANLIATANHNKATAVTITETTEFTVLADLDGCEATGQVTVTVQKQEMTDLKVEGSVGCAGELLTVKAKPNGGMAPFKTEWGESTPAGVVLNNPNAAETTVANSAELSGEYSIPVTVTDAGGEEKTGVAFIRIHPRVEANGSGFCQDGLSFDGLINVVSGEAPFTVYEDMACTREVSGVEWNGKQGKIAGLLSGTTYTYYVKDKNDCNAARVTMSANCECGAQLVVITGTKACAGLSNKIDIVLQASGGESYSFELVNVELGTKVKVVRNEPGPSWTVPIDYADRGKYRVDNFKAVTERTKPGSCDGNVTPAFVDVQFWPTPVVDAGGDRLICGNEMVTLKGNGDPGLTYTWSNGVEDGVPFQPNMGYETEYTLTGTDEHGCSNTDKITVAAYEKPQVKASASPNVICKGQMVTLVQNGTADDYTWNNGGVTGANNMPEMTTRYVLTGTNTTTGCSDTSSVLVVVNQSAEIIEGPKNRTIAIGKNASFKVEAIGNNLVYEWQWYNKSQDLWQTFTNSSTSSPKVSGADTSVLLLEEVPQSWDGTKIKCVVKGDCGEPAQAEAMLYVKECFDILVDLKMTEGIRPADSDDGEIDGWYCKGNRIGLQALVSLADPQYGTIANPHFTWTIDGLPNPHVIESDSSVLSWVPEYWEDDIVVKVCVYSDGACDEVCSRHLRLKARTPDNVRMQIVTSVDPLRMFCPGDSINFTVALANAGKGYNIHWYRDIFDKGDGLIKTFVMDQKDTWVRAVFEPSDELCLEKAVEDSVFLRVKEYVTPALRIDNNIHDTIACQGDTLIFQAFWENAGSNPQLTWWQDIWDRGYGEYATIGLNDKDTWVKCVLVPGEDVCYDGPQLMDTMVVRVREAGTLTITAELEDKRPGDELTFVSEVENMTGTWKYSWYINNNLNSCEEKDFVTDELRQGDVVKAAIEGMDVCLNKIFSNEIVVKYDGYVNRDTMLTIYQDETVKNLDMRKECDEEGKVWFLIETQAMFGTATMNPNGKFNYIPNNGFTGTDWVKYIVMNKTDRTVIAEGYIYITVRENNRFLIPNIITPNDDGLNDTWKLDFLADYPDHRITVYNRDGNVVFTGSKYQNDWDGTGYTKGSYVGQINLANGVYTYVIELGDKNKTVLKSWIEIRANLNRRDYR